MRYRPDINMFLAGPCVNLKNHNNNSGLQSGKKYYYFMHAFGALF
jgi:hypothetical protein